MRMHFDSTRELHTASLLLRPLQLEDSVAMFGICAEPETMKYWSSEPVLNHSDAQRLVRERWYVYGRWQDSVMLGLLITDLSQ